MRGALHIHHRALSLRSDPAIFSPRSGNRSLPAACGLFHLEPAYPVSPNYEAGIVEQPTGSFQKGGKPGPGRPKGLPNKTTQEARRAIAEFVDGNVHRLTGWLDQVANGIPEQDIKPNPARAFELFQSVVEYHIPKLARTEHTGDGGGPVVIQASSLDERL